MEVEGSVLERVCAALRNGVPAVVSGASWLAVCLLIHCCLEAA